jgi:hypothetical protein
MLLVPAIVGPERCTSLHNLQEASLFPVEQPVLSDGYIPGTLPPKVCLGISTGNVRKAIYVISSVNKDMLF